MPTNILRKRYTAVSAKDRPEKPPPGRREILITAGRVRLRALLLATQTADRIWAALPLFSTAETWGQAIHFETPIETGRERGARLIGDVGDVYFWSDDDRILIVFGPTPISKPGEIRLPRPCNVWAKALDDVRVLKVVQPGEKVSVTAA